MTGKRTENITGLFKKNYFWDIDINRTGTISMKFVVERVFSFGTLEEVALLIRHYGRKEVEKTLLNLNYIDPKTLNFVSKFFSRPETEFKCCIRKQLKVQYWDY